MAARAALRVPVAARGSALPPDRGKVATRMKSITYSLLPYVWPAAGGHFSSVWQGEGATDSAAAAGRSSHAAPIKQPQWAVVHTHAALRSESLCACYAAMICQKSVKPLSVQRLSQPLTRPRR